MKKIISLLLALIMTISVATGVTMTAQAATTGNQVVSYARQFLGSPYRNPGANPPYSFDCSSFVWYVYKHFGYNFSLSSSDYWSHPERFGTVVATGSTANARPGDIISWSGHVAIYTENGYCVEALNPSYGVCDTVAVDKHTNGKNYRVIRVSGVDYAPFNVINYKATYINPNTAKLRYTITSPNGYAIEKRNYYYKKQSDTSWKGGSKTYSSPSANNINAVFNLSNLAENTTYDFRVGIYFEGKWHAIYQTTFKTPAKTSIAGTSVPNTKVKYTGSNISTASLLNVTVDGKKLAAGNDYTVSPSTVKDIGRHKVTITGKNWYKDSVTTYVTVYPKTPTVNSVTYNRTTNRISVKWARVAVCDYQQVAISTSPNFEPSKTCIYRVDQNKQSASFCKITFNGTQTTIKKGKTYYVRMRAYKTVNGTRIYGAYGAKRTIKCN